MTHTVHTICFIAQVPESLLESDSFDLPAWNLSSELLEKLRCPVLLFASATDSAADIERASKALPPDLLLLTGPDGFTAAAQFPHDKMCAVRQVQPSCSLLGVLPAVRLRYLYLHIISRS